MSYPPGQEDWPLSHRSFAVLSSLLLLAGCAQLDQAAALGAAGDAYQVLALSDEQVNTLAGQAAAESDAQNTLAGADSPYAKRLRALVAPHVGEGGLDLDFRVYLTDDVNAFAMADGTVRVYRGLMDLMEDDELRFVLGHEIGHVELGHSRKSLQVAYSAMAARKGAAALGGTTATLARSQLGELSERLVRAQFSQRDELAADDYSLRFLARHGYPPEPAVSALRKLGGGPSSFLSSHPDSETRAERIAARLARGG
jgi:putative metalloprotease